MGCKWASTIKYTSDGSNIRYNSWLVSKGITLTNGIGSFGKVKIEEHVLTSHKLSIKILNRSKIKNIEIKGTGLVL
ncbi:SNF1-related kinase alpha subunit, putative [Medicago truncatula]|uniref:SNF1-related kinase alpha subunit, putative n=1 Tax=Medicago truncatula TaxID=3880 RepID=G7KKZ9_MEDTR|nr:SNF1-related kinase alpha subunit, putative [Medicago truncatula]